MLVLERFFEECNKVIAVSQLNPAALPQFHANFVSVVVQRVNGLKIRLVVLVGKRIGCIDHAHLGKVTFSLKYVSNLVRTMKSFTRTEISSTRE